MSLWIKSLKCVRCCQRLFSSQWSQPETTVRMGWTPSWYTAFTELFWLVLSASSLVIIIISAFSSPENKMFRRIWTSTPVGKWVWNIPWTKLRSLLGRIFPQTLGAVTDLRKRRVCTVVSPPPPLGTSWRENSLLIPGSGVLLWVCIGLVFVGRHTERQRWESPGRYSSLGKRKKRLIGRWRIWKHRRCWYLGEIATLGRGIQEDPQTEISILGEQDLN